MVNVTASVVVVSKVDVVVGAVVGGIVSVLVGGSVVATGFIFKNKQKRIIITYLEIIGLLCN